MAVILMKASDAKVEISKSGLMILDIFATWCGPCKMLAPILDKVQEDTKINIIKMDADENAPVLPEFKASSLPTVIFYKNGEEIDRFTGFRPEQQIVELINKHK